LAHYFSSITEYNSLTPLKSPGGSAARLLCCESSAGRAGHALSYAHLHRRSSTGGKASVAAREYSSQMIDEFLRGLLLFFIALSALAQATFGLL
jgi:hypothetical protein